MVFYTTCYTLSLIFYLIYHPIPKILVRKSFINYLQVISKISIFNIMGCYRRKEKERWGVEGKTKNLRGEKGRD